MEKCCRCNGTGYIRLCNFAIFYNCKYTNFIDSDRCIKCASKLTIHETDKFECKFCNGSGRVEWIDNMFRKE